MRRRMMIVVVGVAILAVVALSLLSCWPAINVVETGKTPEYPDIAPRRYEATVERVFDATLHAVNRLPRWSLRSYQPETREIHAEARTRLFQFVDDVHVRVTNQGDEAVVQVRSASRVGKGDFGQNARNIRALFGAIDEQMQASDGHR